MANETMAEQQKKRTMEALERRFAQAEAEIHQQQHKNKKIAFTTTKTPAENNIGVTSQSINSSPSPLKSTTTSSAPSSKKGHISFSGHTSAQDVELNNPAYLQISHSVDDNLLKITTEISGKNMTANDILHDLLQHGDSAQKYMQGSKNVKVDNWILLDNVVQKSSIATGARSRALQRQSKRSKRHMSIKQHKKFGSFDLPRVFHNYDIFKPMHDKWKDYVAKLLKNIGKNQLSQCLLTADLHGALILVVQCKIAGLIGVRGIMIRETVETFGIITEDNKFQGKVLKQIDKYRRNFLWEGNSNTHKFHLIKWERVIQPKSQGGLGIRDLSIHNKSMLMKWLWRYTQVDQTLWKKVVNAKHGTKNHWSTKVVSSPYGVGPWKYISKLGEELYLNCKFKVGNGSKVRFWEDIWLGDSTLQADFPSLYAIATRKSSTISQNRADNAWIPQFRRNFQDWELQDILSLLERLGAVQINDQSPDRLIWGG